MRRTLPIVAPPVVLWGLAAAWTAWWVGHNPLPDGFQNEYLHVGNAYDLWRALVEGDWWTLRWVMYTNYWPWGFYAVPWPFLAVAGLGRASLVAGNLVHLAVLLWAARSLGRALDAPLAPAWLLLCPGVFGTLVRYEPNLAAIAWTLAGLAFLVRSQGLRRRREAVLWGVALGVGLMMDRLTVGFFLLPAAVPLLWGRGRAPGAWRNLAWGLAAAALLSAAWYREFFLRNAEEIFSQAPVGEIDAAGAVNVSGGGAAWYLLALLDSQAGPVLGGLMVLGALAAAREAWRGRGTPGAWRPRAVLLAAVLPAMAFFTLIAKKQVFYTLPALGPLAVLAARGRWRWLGVAGGLWAFLDAGLGVVPDGFPGSPWMPEAWVAPRHTLARPPSGPVPGLGALRSALAALPETRSCAGELSREHAEVVVFSEDETLYEGFVALSARERLPRAFVRGVVLDPVGTYEEVGRSDAILRVGPAGAGEPDRRRVLDQLVEDHYRVDELPPVVTEFLAAFGAMETVGRWREGDVVVELRRRACPAG